LILKVCPDSSESSEPNLKNFKKINRKNFMKCIICLFQSQRPAKIKFVNLIYKCLTKNINLKGLSPTKQLVLQHKCCPKGEEKKSFTAIMLSKREEKKVLQAPIVQPPMSTSILTT
jgi:hypothetical protein